MMAGEARSDEGELVALRRGGNPADAVTIDSALHNAHGRLREHVAVDGNRLIALPSSTAVDAMRLVDVLRAALLDVVFEGHEFGRMRRCEYRQIPGEDLVGLKSSRRRRRRRSDREDQRKNGGRQRIQAASALLIASIAACAPAGFLPPPCASPAAPPPRPST